MVLSALILTIIKILLELFLYIVSKLNQRESMLYNLEGKSCIYLHDDICSNILFKQKMSNGICPRQSCKGFNINIAKDNIEIINSPIFLLIKKIIDLFPEFAAALLAINELLN